jgi:hypothetical protein
MTLIPTKTKTSFYRRLYIAYLIDTGVGTVPQIMFETGMPRRTVQDTIKSLSELDIICEFVGATKDGNYVISDWGAINTKWIKTNLQHVKDVL